MGAVLALAVAYPGQGQLYLSPVQTVHVHRHKRCWAQLAGVMCPWMQRSILGMQLPASPSPQSSASLHSGFSSLIAAQSWDR